MASKALGRNPEAPALARYTRVRQRSVEEQDAHRDVSPGHSQPASPPEDSRPGALLSRVALAPAGPPGPRAIYRDRVSKMKLDSPGPNALHSNIRRMRNDRS